MSEAIWDDKPTEECGVFGIFAPEQDVARITFFGLYALQHRGQESAGIATSDGEHVSIRTRIVSWKEATEMKLSMDREALIMPSSTG